MDSAQYYKLLVINALRSVNEFYISIQGAQGLVNYLSNTLGLGNICGKTNPNFCSFNPVSFFLILFSAFSLTFLFVFMVH